MAWLKTAIANKLDFMSPMEVPPIKFSFDETKLNQWKAILQWTKDASLLTQYEYQHIFIYDRLMEGQDDHKKNQRSHLTQISMGFYFSQVLLLAKEFGKAFIPHRSGYRHPAS